MPRAARPPRPVRSRSGAPARHHADWIRLVEVSGPFLSVPALARAFPQGLPREEATSDLRKRFRLELDGWEDGSGDPRVHQAFVRFMLREVLAWPAEDLKEGQGLPPGLAHPVAEHGETLRPDLALVNPAGRAGAGKARVQVQLYPPDQDLDRAVEGRRWKASPATRAMELCHAADVPLALVTNGAAWALVHARRGETTTYVTFQAPLFVEEAGLFDAFRALLGRQRLFGVADADTLEALLAESAANQQEVTDQLGAQVRHAVEVLVQAVDRANREEKGALLRDISEKTLYEAAVGVMMRLVFLLAAEERKLLLLGDPLYDAHYAASTLLLQLEEAATRHGEEVLERRFAAWARLLATFRAVHGGVDHDRLRLPAYGGSLFDPDRFPFLEGRAPGSRWREETAKPVAVSDRTVYHLLRSLQILELPVPGGGREARRLSFRALDVEQIGHVYEGLLDHTVVRATEPVLGLAGAKGLDPELPLSRLEETRKRGQAELVALLEEETGRSKATLERAVAEPPDDDPEAAGRLLLACDGDERLRDAVKPWAGLLRRDSQEYPLVIKPGSIYLTSGSDRRSTGTHYTPRSLTEPVVQYALEPQVYRGPAEGWPREKWVLRPARELLALRVCDMAMGSGAFLAQACRWLGDRLVEAWEEAEAAAGGKLVVTPEGDLATGAPGERPIPRNAEERITLARRAVAERCLYGVDVNPMAVEIAKLSLWLVTLQKDRPFTFVDHALRAGDSLLGVTSPEQIASFHLDPEKGKALHQNLFNWTAVCEPALKSALEKRRKLESFTVESARDTDEKQRLLAEADQALADVRLVADAVVAAALPTVDRGEEAYGSQLKALASVVSAALDPKARAEGRAAARAQLASMVVGLLNGGKPVRAALRRPFHWALEFPEVFTGDAAARGFGTLVGNPPFMGGQKITGALGTDYRDFCVERLANGRRGSADLCAYFFLRTSGLLKPSGTFGLLATNTIAQGGTREVGLDQLVQAGFAIYRAVPSRKWPGTANLEVAHVWGLRGNWSGVRMLEEVLVRGITSSLSVPGAVAGTPYRLHANAGKSFQGSIVLGMGFLMLPAEAEALIKKSGKSKDVLFLYLNAEDLTSRPDQSPSRWAINFQDWPLTRKPGRADVSAPVAEDYPDCLAILREKVMPERAAKSEAVRDFPWWQHWRAKLEMYSLIASLKRVIVVPRVSVFHVVAWVPTGQIFSDRLVVVTADQDDLFGVLASSLHDAWAHRPGATTHETRNTYFPEHAFETFPFPGRSLPREVVLSLDAERNRVLRILGAGLTELYAAFHKGSPVCEGLRRQTAALDRAVAAAYGWSDLGLGHGFHETRQGIRFTISEAARREVLARLLELNHERYAEEVKQGLHDTGKKGRAKTTSAGQGSLFGVEPAAAPVPKRSGGKRK